MNDETNSTSAGMFQVIRRIVVHNTLDLQTKKASYIGRHTDVSIRRRKDVRNVQIRRRKDVRNVQKTS